jgi:FKBP-type peptidyl-prolyl cis-trans isomerase
MTFKPAKEKKAAPALIMSSGRFTADRRVVVGGYGPPSTNWGSNHPWHTTKDGEAPVEMGCMDALSSQVPRSGEGQSRASKKRKKNKKPSLASESNGPEEAKEALKAPAVKRAKKAKVAPKAPKQTKLPSAPAASGAPTPHSDVELYKLAKQYESRFGETITTPSGLEIIDLSLGKGRLVSRGELITIKYAARVGRTGSIFGKGNLSVVHGKDSLIAGWVEGISTMRTGGHRTLFIPSQLAYGSTGKGTKIPPNSDLFFDMKLVRIGKRQRDDTKEDETPLPSSFRRKH